MPASLTFSALCTALNRHPGVIQDLQKRFTLPVLKGASYTEPYMALLRTLIYLRILGISFDALTQLWHTECSLMRLLHADSTGSPNWFLDSCGSRTNPSRRLLLSGFDTGVALPSGSVQLGLNFAKDPQELFTCTEMGQDALHVLRLYLDQHRAIVSAVRTELPTVQAAIRHARTLTR